MIRSPEKFAAAFAASAEADLLRPSILRMGLSRDELFNLVMTDLEREAQGNRRDPLFPNLRAFMRSQAVAQEAKIAGMGQDFASIAGMLTPLLKTGVDLASTYYSTQIKTDAQIKIAEYQARSAALAQQALNLQAQNLNVQAAVAEGLPQNIANTVASARAGTTMIGGIPVIPVIIGAGVLLLGGVYLFTRRR